MTIQLTEETLKLQYSEDEQQEEPKPPRYILRDASYALSDLPQLDYIVEGIIPERSVGMFFGDPGAKKTYSICSLSSCVAQDKPWLGFAVKGCKVLIIDEESGELRLGRRLGMAIRGELGGADIPIEFVSLANFKLDKKDDLPELQQLITDTGAGLVIIDALADVMDGDENAKKDTQPVFTALRKLAELTGAAIIIIHHANKGGGYRGSSAIKGALDFMYKVESDEESNFITFKAEKARDSKAASFTAAAHWTENQFYLTPAEAKPKEKRMTEGMQYVLRYLKRQGPSPISHITAAVDTCSERQARDGIYSLAKPEWNLIYRTNPNDKGQGVEAIYALRDEDDEE
jgi:predicted ATP-dependent serine protease